ncbi:MAG: TlpA disulfide reductase family protein [Gammaproteobacteria bacterium]
MPRFRHTAQPALLLTLLWLVSPALPAAGVLEVSTLEGEHARLSDYLERGRHTLVMVWTTYCTVCASEFPRIDALHRAHHDDGLKVLGVAVDGLAARASVQAALDARGASFPSVLIERAELAAGFHRYTGETFRGTPTYLLFDGAGELAGHHVGRLDVDAVARLLNDGGS